MLGLSVMIYPRKGSAFRVADSLWMVASFGLTHGIHEWIELFFLIRPESAGRFIRNIDLALHAGSYCFLILFGARIITAIRPELRLLKSLAVAFPLLWGALLLLSPELSTATSVWTRYLLGFPGALLSAYAFLLQEDVISAKHPSAGPLLKTVAGAFLGYALLAGLAVPDAEFFPASLFNYSFFTNTLGVPVQVLRTACAVVMTYGMIRVLAVFDWETKAELRRSRDALERAYLDVDEKVRERTAALMLTSSRLQREILEHGRSENDLKLFRSLMNQSNDAIFIIEVETGRVLNANERAGTTLQYSCDELLKLHVFDYALNVTDIASWQRCARKIEEQGHFYFETMQRRKDGELLPVEVSARFILHDGKKYIVSIARDISERRRAQTALEKWADIFTCTKIGVVIIGPSGKTLDMMNPAFASMHGYDVEELSGRPIEDIVAPEKRVGLPQQMEMIRRQKHVVYDAVNLRKDGTQFPVQIDATVMSEGNGEVLYYIVNVVDISDRKQVEEVLRYSSRQWRTTFDAMQDMLFLLDSAGKIKRCNQSALQYLKRPMEDIIGQSCCDLIHGRSQRNRACLLQRVLDGGKREREILQLGEVWFDVIVDPLLSESGDVVGAVHLMHDITDAKKMEAELMKAQKLESIGVLAGGIAHDFNNILTGIMGNISLALLDHDIGGNTRKRLGEADKACERAKDLTQRLLTFASGGAPIKRIMPVTDIVKDTVALALTGSAVRAEFSLPEEQYLTEIDEGQMRQVIHNITTNAVEAMPSGGIVQVTCQRATSSAGLTLPAAADVFVRITIRDEGPGIPQENLANIFDPFFTTKQKRSGLGLATSYSIIKNHGGSLAVESEPGQGTAFHIYLPVRLENQAREAGTSASAPLGKILIMDDEKIIRDVAAEMLSRTGYEVMTVEDGIEAVRLYGDAMKRAQPFHVVILDLTVPGGMGGAETVAKLLELDGRVKAIVSSGYAKDPIMSHYRDYGFSGVVAKPYKIDDLVRTIKGLMDPSE
jgi:PAS domain S-box-containing protein